MLIVLDIGNTNVMMSVFRDESLLNIWRFPTHPEKLFAGYETLAHNMLITVSKGLNNFHGGIISSVVPDKVPVWIKILKKYIKNPPLVVDHTLDMGITVGTEFPDKVGCDRIVNAAYAHAIFKKSAIIVDMGTATTIDFITENGIFEGGLICPGLSIWADALHHKTAQLPKIKIEKPKNIIGKNTEESIQSGIFFGYIGMVDSLIKKLKEKVELVSGKSPLIIATGGWSHILAGEIASINHIIEDLTLQGLRLIYERNRPNQGEKNGRRNG